MTVMHEPIDIYRYAEHCGCDRAADGYENDHCESDEHGAELCSRSHLGRICQGCAAEWPYPTTVELNTKAWADARP